MVSVLVVEDLPGVRHTAVQILKSLGCEEHDAYNGPEALDLLQAYPEIQILFTDVRMPGMDGLVLAETARCRWPDLKVVLTSGYIGPEELPDDIAFVLKPWRARDIAQVVIEPNRPIGRGTRAAAGRARALSGPSARTAG